ncbi:MAG: YicC/YloC family endoribonuclease [Chlamydiota bacterium]
MLASMTGFGRALLEAPFGKLVVEIQSLNRKYLEVSISLPKEFGRFEQDIRKWVSEAVSRGQVTVRIFLIPDTTSIEQFLPDIEVLQSAKRGWERIAEKLGLSAESIDLSFIMDHLPASQKLEMAHDEDLKHLHQCVGEALKALVQMKKTEGAALVHDLTNRLKELERMIREIESLSPDAAKKMREKLFEKMAEVLKPGIDADERLLREVALFAERVDISEELTRFHSHLMQWTYIWIKGKVFTTVENCFKPVGFVHFIVLGNVIIAQKHSWNDFCHCF